MTAPAMKVSIITSVFNGKETIEQSINSVLSQTYKNIEYIVIDGGSTDRTQDVIQKYLSQITKIINIPDQGIYYALNKGIEESSGDIIGFLHADDFYTHDKIIQMVVSYMTKYNVDSCYGDLIYVAKNNTKKIVRYWKSRILEDGLLKKGWMPPHPTFFVKKEIYNNYGNFNTQLRISADYELMLRFLGKNKISTCYIPEILIAMRTGGISNGGIKSLIKKTSEDYRAWKVNGLDGALYAIPLKKISKIPQFFKRNGMLNGKSLENY